MRKIVRARATDIPEVTTPACPKDQTPMQFDRLSNTWKCSTCGYQAISGKTHGAAIIGKPPFELMRYDTHDRQTFYVLRSSNGIAMDITDQVKKANQDGAGVIVKLRFDRYTILEET